MMLDPLVRSMLLQLRFLVRLSIFASSSSRPRHCLYPFLLGSPNIHFIFDRSSVVSASTMSPPHTLPIHTLRLSMYCSRCGLILGIYTNHLIPFGPSLWLGHPSWSWSRHLSCTVIACSVLLNIIMRYCIMISCACPTLSTSNARDALITNRHVVCVLQSFLLVHGGTFDK